MVICICNCKGIAFCCISKINYVTDICFSLLIISSYTMNLMDLYVIMSISNNFNNIAMGIKDQTDSLKDIISKININYC